jgi:hypothetical protein
MMSIAYGCGSTERKQPPSRYRGAFTITVQEFQARKLERIGIALSHFVRGHLLDILGATLPCRCAYGRFTQSSYTTSGTRLTFRFAPLFRKEHSP